MRCYWWREQDNFGDRLAPLLLSHFCGVFPHWSEPQDAEIVSTGSVLDMLPQNGFRGIVAGSGQLLTETKIDLGQAAVLGLRGCLTWNRVYHIPVRDIVLGDPGLLVSELVNVKRDSIPLGLVPHCSDTELFKRELERSRRDHWNVEPILIDPAGDPIEVVRQIGSCSKIISSSLHGIIAADAFGIPRRAEMFAGMTTNPHEGGDFKWRDYASVLEQPIEFGTLQEAPRNRVESIQYDLFDMFVDLRRILNVAS